MQALGRGRLGSAGDRESKRVKRDMYHIVSLFLLVFTSVFISLKICVHFNVLTKYA